MTALPLPIELPDAEDLPILEVTVQVEAIGVTESKAHATGALGTEPEILTPQVFLDGWVSLHRRSGL